MELTKREQFTKEQLIDLTREDVEFWRERDELIPSIHTSMRLRQAEIALAALTNKRAADIETMLKRLYAECDTGERRGNGSQSGVAMPSWETVEAARLLLWVK